MPNGHSKYRQQVDPGDNVQDHRSCDHANDYCALSPNNSFSDPQGEPAMAEQVARHREAIAGLNELLAELDAS